MDENIYLNHREDPAFWKTVEEIASKNERIWLYKNPLYMPKKKVIVNKKAEQDKYFEHI